MITIQNVKEFLAALTLATKVASNKSPMPALAMVRLTNTSAMLRTVATDLETWQVYTAPVTCDDTGAPLDVAVNAKMLHTVVKKLGEGIAMERNGDKLDLHSGKRKLSLDTFPVANLPLEPEPTQQVIEFNKAELLPAWAFVHKAVSQDNTRSHLMAVHVEASGRTARLVATDGHRLNLTNVVGQGGNLDAVTNVPSGIALAMLNTMKASNGAAPTVGFGADKTHTVLYCGAHTVVGRLPTDERDFPPYDRVIPTHHDTVVKVDAVTLREAMDLAGTVATSGNHGAVFTFGANSVEVSAVDPDMGKVSETIPLTYEKCYKDTKGFQIGFNVSYFLDVLKDRKGAVTIGFSAALDPMVLRWDDNSLAVIMPLRL